VTVGSVPRKQTPCMPAICVHPPRNCTLTHAISRSSWTPASNMGDREAGGGRWNNDIVHQSHAQHFTGALLDRYPTEGPRCNIHDNAYRSLSRITPNQPPGYIRPDPSSYADPASILPIAHPENPHYLSYPSSTRGLADSPPAACSKTYITCMAIGCASAKRCNGVLAPGSRY
jgi:hypothetical protein